LTRLTEVQQPNTANLVLEQQLLGFVGEHIGKLGLRILDDWLDLLAQHAAGGIDLLNGQQFRVLQRRLADCHGAT